LSTGALSVPGKARQGRDNKARACFSQIFVLFGGKAKICEKKHRSFFEAVGPGHK
jgi:hypothetical protein